MKTITFKKITNEQCHQMLKKFENDPIMFSNDDFTPFVYSFEKGEKYYQKSIGSKERIEMVIFADEEIIGSLVFKKINPSLRECDLGIHLCNDSFKNKGYGTEAEKLAIDYAFNTLNMRKIYADSLKKNLRSQHVLEKVGFIQISEDNDFIYYQIEKAAEDKKCITPK